MRAKEIAILIVFIVFIVPTLFSLASYTFKVSQDPGNISHVEEGITTAVEGQIPWYLGIMQKFAELPGILGALFIFALIVFLKWIGEIK